MKSLLLAAALICSFFTTALAQIPVGRTTMEYEVEYDGTQLKMNGAGVRSLLFIELYSGGLYLQKKSSDPIAIAYADETMAIRIKITSKIIDREVLLNAIEEGFSKATDGNIAPFKIRINQMRSLFSDPIVKEDVIELAYIKDRGTVCYKNSEELGVVEGSDFKFVLYKIWLGENPASKSLKKGMLGKG